MWFICINYFNFTQRPFHLLSHLSEAWNYGGLRLITLYRGFLLANNWFCKKVRQFSAIITIACIGYSVNCITNLCHCILKVCISYTKSMVGSTLQIRKLVVWHAKWVRTLMSISTDHFSQSCTLLLISTDHFLFFAVLQITFWQCAMWILRVRVCYVDITCARF
jgi:hypothetical protein